MTKDTSLERTKTMTNKELMALKDGQMVILISMHKERVAHTFHKKNINRAGYWTGTAIYQPRDMDKPTKADFERALAVEEKRHAITIDGIKKAYELAKEAEE